jgi:hypothetical protein
VPPSLQSRIERTVVAEALQPQLRLYRRLYLARMDLEESRATVQDLLARRILPPRNKPPSPILLALTTALVVSYARPFVNSRGQSDVAEKAVPGVLLRVLTASEREIHEAILAMRNKEVAHADADILDIRLELFEGGDGAVLKNSRAPFTRPILKRIQRMIEKLEGAMDQRCEELRTELPLNVWL